MVLSTFVSCLARHPRVQVSPRGLYDEGDDRQSTTNSLFQNQEEDDVQRNFRLLKSRIIAIEMNTEAFLKICTPDQKIWEKFGWKGKKVGDIISQIVERGLPACM